MSEKSSMNFLAHIKELRFRVQISFISFLLLSVAAFFFYAQISEFFLAPFSSLAGTTLDESLVVSSLFEGFVTKFKLAFVMGFVLSFPISAFQFLRFVFPGLKKRERRLIAVCLIGSAALLALALYLSYFKIVPFTVSFMTSVGFIPDGVGVILNFHDSVFYVVQMVFYALLLFQLPVIMVILMAMELLSRRAVLKAGRYVVVGIFAVSAIITPPDLISQLSLSLPLIALFYFSIFIAWVMGWGAGK